jgi:phenol 2-monooxygenase
VDANDTPGEESAYKTFGVGESGALVVVRPDGHIGAVLSLEDVKGLGQYFAGFMNNST